VALEVEEPLTLELETQVKLLEMVEMVYHLLLQVLQ
jgi:hypothetical protein